CRLPSDPNRKITKISSQSMAVLNTIVKDFIARFTAEADRLVASSKNSTLSESAALGAIRMMLRHREDLCAQVIAQYKQLLTTPTTRKRSAKRSGKHMPQEVPRS